MATRLVTGANGCIGAWVVRRLLESGDEVTALDHGTEKHRLEALLDPESLARVRFLQADVSNAPVVRKAIEAHGFDGVIHLAGLQVPTCRTDPMLGATVNVLGTLAVFEAAAAGFAGALLVRRLPQTSQRARRRSGFWNEQNSQTKPFAAPDIAVVRLPGGSARGARARGVWPAARRGP